MYKKILFKRYKSNQSNINGSKSLNTVYNNTIYYTYYFQTKFIIINFFIKYIVIELFSFFNIDVLNLQLKLNNKYEIKIYLLLRKKTNIKNIQSVIFFLFKYMNKLIKNIFNLNIMWHVKLNRNHSINCCNYLNNLILQINNNHNLKKEINKLKKQFYKLKKKQINLRNKYFSLNTNLDFMYYYLEYLFFKKKYFTLKKGIKITIKGIKDKRGKANSLNYLIGKSNTTNLKKNIFLEKENIITKTGIIGISIYII